MASRIPFGKFKGECIEGLPFAYLEWLLDEGFLREPLASKIRAEYERRRCSQETDRDVNAAVADELIAAGLRALALKYHPDRGGDHQKMVAVNESTDCLRQQVRPLA